MSDQDSIIRRKNNSHKIKYLYTLPSFSNISTDINELVNIVAIYNCSQPPDIYNLMHLWASIYTNSTVPCASLASRSIRLAKSSLPKDNFKARWISSVAYSSSCKILKDLVDWNSLFEITSCLHNYICKGKDKTRY